MLEWYTFRIYRSIICQTSQFYVSGYKKALGLTPINILCKTSGKPSTRFPLGRLVELENSPNEKNVRAFKQNNQLLWKVGGIKNFHFINSKVAVHTMNPYNMKKLLNNTLSIGIHTLYVKPHIFARSCIKKHVPNTNQDFVASVLLCESIYRAVDRQPNSRSEDS